MKGLVKLLLIIIVLAGTAFYYHIFSFKGFIAKAKGSDILLSEIKRMDFIDNPFNSKEEDYIVFFMTDKGPRYEFVSKTEKELFEGFASASDVKNSELTIFVGIGAVVAIVVIILIPTKKKR